MIRRILHRPRHATPVLSCSCPPALSSIPLYRMGRVVRICIACGVER